MPIREWFFASPYSERGGEEHSRASMWIPKERADGAGYNELERDNRNRFGDGFKIMIQKTVTKRNLRDQSSIRDDLNYWLSRPPEERIDAVEKLRRQYYGNTARLQRIARVVQQTRR